MYFKEVAYAMKENITLNSKFKPKVSYIEELFYCNEKNIGQSEFYQSALVGLKPTIKLQTNLLDLTGVTHIKYHDHLYKILRTYKTEDSIEITLTSTLIENKNTGEN